MDYIAYFFITLLISTFFALGGLGSAAALVPIFDMMGMPLNLAKAIGLFINSASTITASFMNILRKSLDIGFAIPLVVSIMISTPMGAYASRFVEEDFVRGILVLFLLFSSFMLLFGKKKQKFKYTKRWLFYPIGFFVGMLSGLIGVGGGSLILPLLIMLGWDSKKISYAVSFVIPFSTLGAFFTYATFVKIDFTLLFITAIAAIIGGYIGNKISHFHLSSLQIRKIIGVLLLIIAANLAIKLLNF